MIGVDQHGLLETMPTIRLTRSLTDDLTAVSALGPEPLNRISRAIGGLSLTIKRSVLRQTIVDEIGKEAAATLERFLFGMAVARRHGVTTVSGLLDSVQEGLAKLNWKPEELARWENSRPALDRLLNLPSIQATAKAIDLSYDFARVCTETRILTDIRPVFGEENGRKTEIIGTTVTQTLRIDYTSPLGDEQTISIALDVDDVKQLLSSCEEAIQKAAKARQLLEERCKLPTTMPGEEEGW
jgi:hypothetical protein